MESMKVCNYLRSRLTMTQLHSNIKIKRNHWAYESEFLWGACMLKGNKFLFAKSGSNNHLDTHAHKSSKSFFRNG